MSDSLYEEIKEHVKQSGEVNPESLTEKYRISITHANFMVQKLYQDNIITVDRKLVKQPKSIDDAHAELVVNLAKPGDEIRGELSDSTAHLLHMAVGVSGEAGELLDAVKKHCIYGKPLDVENVIEELGDLYFYMQGILNELDVNREQCIQANISKLNKRYPSGSYSNDQAKDRADKSG